MILLFDVSYVMMNRKTHPHVCTGFVKNNDAIMIPPPPSIVYMLMPMDCFYSHFKAISDDDLIMFLKMKQDP